LNVYDTVDLYYATLSDDTYCT